MLLFFPRSTVCFKKSMVPKRKWWYHLYSSSRPTDVHLGFCCPIQSHSSPSHVGPDPSLRRQQTAMASEGNRGNDAGYHWVAPPLHPNPKKETELENCVFPRVNVRKLRLQCWGAFFGQKGGVKWSYMLILWDERVATANWTLFGFFSGFFRMQEMLHSGLGGPILFSDLVFKTAMFWWILSSNTVSLEKLLARRFLNQVPSLIHNKKHGFEPPNFLNIDPKNDAGLLQKVSPDSNMASFCVLSI